MATITLVKKNLFDVPHGYCLAHCISEDFRLGAGIAVEFNNRYNMRERLQTKFGTNGDYVGKALKIDNVYNLITKQKCFEKPTYQSLQKALEDMASQIKNDHIKNLAMPKIGAGLDKLKWTIVLSIIKEVFKDTNVNITICFLDDDPDFSESADELSSYFEDEQSDGEDWTACDYEDDAEY